MRNGTRRVVAITDSSGHIELVDLERAIVVSADSESEALSLMGKRYDMLREVGAYGLIPRTPERYLELAESAYLNSNGNGSVSVYRHLGWMYWRREATGGWDVPMTSVDFR